MDGALGSRTHDVERGIVHADAHQTSCVSQMLVLSTSRDTCPGDSQDAVRANAPRSALGSLRLQAVENSANGGRLRSGSHDQNVKIYEGCDMNHKHVACEDAGDVRTQTNLHDLEYMHADRDENEGVDSDADPLRPMRVEPYTYAAAVRFGLRGAPRQVSFSVQ